MKLAVGMLRREMDVTHQLRRIETIVPRRADGFGGKARNLAALARAGFPVPAAYALSVASCNAFLDSALSSDEKMAVLIALPEAQFSAAHLRDIATKVENAPLPEELVRVLRDVFVEFKKNGAQSLAVRSSSTCEDDDAASAAGMHTTILNVISVEGLCTAVRKCWASLFEERVIAYLRSIAGAKDASLGIIIQAMVPADVAGVLFTVDPLTGDTNEMVLNASFGLGTLVVDGRVSPDFYRVDKQSGLMRDRVIGDKRWRAELARDGGVVELPLSDSDAQREALTDSELMELIALGRRIETHFGDARDVEWSFAGGVLYVLQARPVTTVAVRPTKAKGRSRKDSSIDRSKLVWSNVNVGEALPGVVTPYTWSVASNFSELGFRKAFAALGCAVPKDAELVGNFRGRLYLNLSEMFLIAAQVPGVRPSTLLSWIGGGEISRLEELEYGSGYSGFLFRLPLTVARFAQQNMSIGAKVESFESQFNAEMRRIRGVDMRILAPAALASILHDIETLLDDTGSIMLTCYGNLLMSIVALRQVLRHVAPDRYADLERDLTSGLADLDSAAPGVSLWHIAEMLRTEPDARDFVMRTSSEKMRVTDLPDGPTRRALERFLDAYGDRGAREAELAEPRWREDPSLLFAILRIHLDRQSEADGPLEMERRQRRLRDESEAELERLLPPPLRMGVRHLLALVQRFVRLRERLRAQTVQVLGLFRSVAVEGSRRIAMREACGDDAAFFLSVEELKNHLTGRLPSVATLVRGRRAQFLRDISLPNPPDTFVGSPPPIVAEPPRTDELRGLASSSGCVQGRVRVLTALTELSQFRSGEILVAPYADVGLSPLFLVVRAVVTDLGGPLSHAAIVAREYGVPMVMNVKVGTRLLKTGDLVEVDGNRGIVRILEKAKAHNISEHA